MRQGWLLIRLAPLYQTSDTRRGLAVEEAGRLAGSDDRALAACALYLHGDLLCNAEEFRQGLAEMAEATVMLNALPQGERARVQASGMAAEYVDGEGSLRDPMPWLAFLGRYREAQAMAERAVAGLPSPGRGGRTVMRAYRTLAVCHAAFGRPDEARAAYARNRAILRTLGAHAQLAINTVDELERVVLPYCTEQIAERRRMTMDGEEEWRRSGGAVRPGALASGFLPRLAHVPMQILDGRWDAVRATTQGTGALEGGSATAPIAARALGAVARHQGEATLAWELVRAALPAGPASAPGEARFFDRVAMQRLAIALSLDADDLPAARTWLEMYDRWMAWSETVHGLSEGETLWARYHRAAGDEERACAHAERALGHATAPRQPLALLAAHRLLGELASDAGRYEEAETHLGAALTLADACVASFERALTLLAFAPLRAKTGDRDAATALLDEARAICIPLDAVPTLARIDALAARLARTSAHPSRYPDALSQREVEVLRLLTQGMSNSAIADELFVSVRTVERHIRNLYTKIDVHNRADATAYAFRHNLT